MYCHCNINVSWKQTCLLYAIVLYAIPMWQLGPDPIMYIIFDQVQSLVLDQICLALLVSGPILDIGPGSM